MKRLNEKQWRDDKELRDAVLLKAVDTEVTASEEERVLNFRISTETPDSYNDVIKSDGWDLERFQKNPVVLWAHDHRQPPVGKALSVDVEDSALTASAQFADAETYAFADTVFRLLKGGFLNATSVGFFPKEWTFDEERGGYNFIEQELFEFSVVPVPANPDALTMALKSGEIDMAPLKEWAEQTLDAWAPDEAVALWIPKTQIEEVYRSLSPEPPTTVTTPELKFDAAATSQSNGTSPDVVVVTSSGTTDAAQWSDGGTANPTIIGDNTTTAPQTTDTIVLNGDTIVDPVEAAADADDEVEKLNERLDTQSDEIESLKAQVDQLLAKIAADEAAAQEAEGADDLSCVIDLSFEPSEIENEVDRSIVDLEIDPEQLHDAIRRQLETELMKVTGKLPKEV